MIAPAELVDDLQRVLITGDAEIGTDLLWLDDRAYPFIPVVLIPSTTWRWKRKKTMSTGTSDRNDIAKIATEAVRRTPTARRAPTRPPRTMSVSTGPAHPVDLVVYDCSGAPELACDYFGDYELLLLAY